MLHGAAETKPRGQRDAARCLRRKIAEIEGDQSEASAFEQQIRNPQKLFQVVLGLMRIFPAAHPQQPVQFDPRGATRLRVDTMRIVYLDAEFRAAAGYLRQCPTRMVAGRLRQQLHYQRQKGGPEPPKWKTLRKT